MADAGDLKSPRGITSVRVRVPPRPMVGLLRMAARHREAIRTTWPAAASFHRDYGSTNMFSAKSGGSYSVLLAETRRRRGERRTALAPNFFVWHNLWAGTRAAGRHGGFLRRRNAR